ncbi:MAG: PQQ-binding-like beta-propeller repeat protein [Alphaproteobacteria bacterium]|nr:PQQ-binding-like beta-propeller repeat protein [Alphaproteobacteria bacterium]
MKSTLLCAGLLACTVPVTAANAADQSEYAVTYQITPAHSGEMNFAAGFAPPLAKVWSKDLKASLSYPLVADGMVFETANRNDVFALNLITGKTKWEHLLGDSIGAAYDNGQLFFVSFGGTMTALKSLSGKVNWSVQLPGQYAFSSPPTAIGGQVFTGGAGSGGTVYGVDESNGHVQWTAGVENGDDSSPAYGDGGLYVSYPCQFYKFATDGKLLWHYSGGCEGGGGATPSYYGKRVFIQDWANGNYVLNASTGDIVGTYAGNATPGLFTNSKGKGQGLSLVDGKLYCWGYKTQNVTWSFTGDGDLRGLPVVVNGVVYVGSGSGMLFALDSGKGKKLWSTNVGASIDALSAGQGALIVNAGSTVSVFAPQ